MEKTLNKEKQIIKPAFLKFAGKLILESEVEPSDIIFFHGRKNVQLAKVNNNEYDIYINE